MAVELVFKNQGSSRPPASNYRNRNHRRALLHFKDEILEWYRSGLTAHNIIEQLKHKSNGQCIPSKGQLEAELRHWGLSRYIKRSPNTNANRGEPTIPATLNPKPEPCTESMFNHCLRQARRACTQCFDVDAILVDRDECQLLTSHLTNRPNAFVFRKQRLLNRQRLLEVVIRCLQFGIANGILVANMVMMAASHLTSPSGPDMNDREVILVHLRGAKAMLGCSTTRFDITGLKDLLIRLITDFEAPETLDPNQQPESLILSSKVPLPRRQTLQMKLAILGAMIEWDSIICGEAPLHSMFPRSCMYFIPRPFRDLVYHPGLIRLANGTSFQIYREPFFKGMRLRRTPIAGLDFQEQYSLQKLEDEIPGKTYSDNCRW